MTRLGYLVLSYTVLFSLSVIVLFFTGTPLLNSLQRNTCLVESKSRVTFNNSLVAVPTVNGPGLLKMSWRASMRRNMVKLSSGNHNSPWYNLRKRPLSFRAMIRKTAVAAKAPVKNSQKAVAHGKTNDRKKEMP